MKPFLLTILSLTLLCSTGFAKRYLSKDEALKVAFPTATQFKPHTTIATKEHYQQLTDALPTDKPSRLFRYIEAQKSGQPLGYAVVDDVLGKHQPITYMMAFNPDHSIRAIEILVYRESYGDEIARESFRTQFYGKHHGDDLSLGQSIRNITGATISCRSLIRAARDKLAYVSILLPKLSNANAQTHPDPAAQPQTKTDASLIARMQLHMGTTLEIQLHSDNAANAHEAIDAAFAETARIEKRISSWQPQSEISQINLHAGESAVTLSTETYKLLQRAQKLHMQTGERFDPALGPVIELWKRADKSNHLPTPESTQAANAASGMRHLKLLADSQALLTHPEARIDLGALGKGYALERAAQVLERFGENRALLNFGGQLLALDAPEGKAGWSVWIDDAQQPGTPIAHITLKRESIATTADNERGYRIGDQRYSHIIDPTTGKPASANRSVTVISASAQNADAWATALFMVSPEDAQALAQKHQLSLYLVNKAGDFYANSQRFARISAVNAQH